VVYRSMGNKNTNYDTQFMEFAKSVSKKIEKNAKIPDDQEKQVNKVFELETKFKNILNTTAPHKLADVYLSFIHFIKNEVGNILSSQSYFRVKKTSFSRISKFIKNDDAKKLIEFPINYNLAKFIRDNWGGPLPEKAEVLFQKLVVSRQILIENNIPLAINRAKLFYRKTKENNLTLMDLINICLIGLVVGIDKYAGAYTRSWRSTCIGRMTGFMIKEYSETFIKLFPSDRKILYRANMIKYRNKVEDIKELTAAINLSFEEDKKQGMSIPKLPITEDTIENLMNAAHYYSTDIRMSNESHENNPEDSGDFFNLENQHLYTDDEDISDKLERYDTHHQLMLAIEDLDYLQQKILKLKGIK